MRNKALENESLPQKGTNTVYSLRITVMRHVRCQNFLRPATTAQFFSTKPGKDAQFSSSEKITQPPWAQKHLGMSVNLATFGGENKEYKIKSQPIDRFCLISLLYNWTYELMVSPTLYNLA